MEEAYQIITRLRYFTCSSQEIKVTDDISIHKVTETDIKTFRNNKETGISKRNTFVICCKFNNKEDLFKLGNNNPVSMIFRCCDALRLIKCHPVGIGSHIYGKKMPENFVIYKASGDATLAFLRNIYKLEENEVGVLRESFNVLKEFDSTKNVRIAEALSRLNFSYEHGIAHSPTDLMTGFESLFLSGEQELRYKLATRASYLLGQNIEERKYIYNKLSWAYNLRSKLVHGSNTNQKEMTEKEIYELMDNVLITRDLLRRSIILFMKLTKKYSHKKLIENLLDQNVLEEGNLLKTN